MTPLLSRKEEYEVIFLLIDSLNQQYCFQDSPLSMRKEFIENDIIEEVPVIENFQPETKPKPEGNLDYNGKIITMLLLFLHLNNKYTHKS